MVQYCKRRVFRISLQRVQYTGIEIFEGSTEGGESAHLPKDITSAL